MSPAKQERLFDRIYARTLLRIAEGDLKTAQALLGHDEARVENTFYMAQQAIEKALKGVLVHLGLPVPLVHDLAALLSKLPPTSQPPYGYELNELSQFASVRRYEEGHWTPTAEEVADVIHKAGEMLCWAKDEVGK